MRTVRRAWAWLTGGATAALVTILGDQVLVDRLISVEIGLILGALVVVAAWPP